MRYIKALLESLLYFFIVILSQRIAYFGYSIILFRLADLKSSIIDELVYSPNLSSNEKALQIIDQTQTIPIIFGWVIAIGLIGGVYRVVKQKPLKAFRNRLGVVNLLLSTVIGLGLMLLTNGVVNILSEYQVIEPFLEGFLEVSFLWTILIVGVVTPICEELVFRGFIMGKLWETGSKGFAILVQALLFSLSHFSVLQGSSVFLLGIVAGLSVMITKSIMSGILIHAVFNITNLYLYQMDHQYYDVGQLLLFMILGVLLIYFGFEKLKSKTGNDPNSA